MTHTQRMLAFFLLVGMLIPLSGCGNSEADHEISQLPSNIQAAPENIRVAYEYAVDHPQELENYPCYCGCGPMGHASNLDCYIQKTMPDGTIVFDMHATGCGICLDITADAIRMKEEGRSPPEIRAYIDETYSAYGPGTDTPLPLPVE